MKKLSLSLISHDSNLDLSFLVDFCVANIMSSLQDYLGNCSGAFTTFGVLAATYIALKLACSIWKGVKCYVLGSGVDFRKLGEWAGLYTKLAHLVACRRGYLGSTLLACRAVARPYIELEICIKHILHTNVYKQLFPQLLCYISSNNQSICKHS